jgi:hypothetical protein
LEKERARGLSIKGGYLIIAPHGPWFECFILDVSDSGICLDVGELVVPKLFGVAFNVEGKIIRICRWHRPGRAYWCPLRHGKAASARRAKVFRSETSEAVGQLQAALIERDADPVFFAPHHMAGKTRTFSEEHETVRDADRARYLELRAGL